MIKYLVMIPIGGSTPQRFPSMQVFPMVYQAKQGLVGIMEAEDLGHLEHLLLSGGWGSSDWDRCIVSVIVKTEED